MKKICVISTTRADYGLILPVLKELKKQKEIKTTFVVTGTHLSKEYGYTIREIEKDKVKIDAKINIIDKTNSVKSISYTMANTMKKFSEYFYIEKPDAILVLGDRYETLAICCVATNQQIPIFHMCGGETTQGAIDEAIRHSITKMSYLHFTTTEIYRKRVIQLGENPKRVFNVGATSAENVRKIKLLNEKDIRKELGIDSNKKYAIATMHPITLDDNSGKGYIYDLIKAIKKFKNIEFIFTKSNADEGGKEINEILDKESEHIENLHVFNSLGIKKYLSAIKYSSFVIGNSSSGIAEAPLLKVPTINVGDRQKGRIKADSIIDCKPNEKAIVSAINKAITKEFAKKVKNTVSPYRKANTSKYISNIIKKYLVEKKIDLKKDFYDVKF